MRGASIEKHVVRVLLIVGALAILAMMVVVGFNIFGRWLDHPIMGAIEIAGLCGGVAAAIAIPYATRERRNVVVDVIASRLPPRARGFFDAFTFLVSLVAVGFLVYVAFKEARYAASFNEATIVVSAPTAPVKFIWAIGLFLLALVLVREVYDAIRRARGVKQ
jgi:TRAP-type C4-dicarboxylate transport system permease small subunit